MFLETWGRETKEGGKIKDALIASAFSNLGFKSYSERRQTPLRLQMARGRFLSAFHMLMAPRENGSP